MGTGNALKQEGWTPHLFVHVLVAATKSPLDEKASLSYGRIQREPGAARSEEVLVTHRYRQNYITLRSFQLGQRVDSEERLRTRLVGSIDQPASKLRVQYSRATHRPPLVSTASLSLSL